jgi:hypothetical protein
MSAARACFDKGDIVCAREYYTQVSAGQREAAASEEAFAILHENGITMGVFMEVMSNGDAAQGITKLAGKLTYNTGDSAPGVNLRRRIFSAYKKTTEITNNVELRGLVRFMSALALAAATLAEDADVSGDAHVLNRTDIVANPTTCLAPLDAGCDRPTAATIVEAATLNLDGASAETDIIAATPTLGMIDGCLSAINTALGATELGASGDFGAGSGDFAESLITNPSGTDEIYRYGLLSKGVGE